MFKKLAVAGFVIVTFIVYSFHQRNEGTQAVQRVTSSQSQNTTSPQTTSSSSTTSPSAMTSYKDGTYTGKSSDAFYGYVQVRATVSGGRLSDITILNYPQDRDNSIAINNDALPQLKQQAIQAQSSAVDGVSGATDTSQAFMESLGDALAQAKA
jgi:uncharacterized protein with FMN-binding domain